MHFIILHFIIKIILQILYEKPKGIGRNSVFNSTKCWQIRKRSVRSFPKDLDGSITNEMKNSFCAKEHSDFIPPFCYHKVFHTLSRKRILFGWHKSLNNYSVKKGSPSMRRKRKWQGFIHPSLSWHEFTSISIQACAPVGVSCSISVSQRKEKHIKKPR